METLLLSFRTRVDKLGYGHQLGPQSLEAALGVGLVTHQGLVKSGQAAQPRADGVHLAPPEGDLGLGPGLALTQRGLLQVTLCKQKNTFNFSIRLIQEKERLPEMDICEGSCSISLHVTAKCNE